jgi:hypothetical protein
MNDGVSLLVINKIILLLRQSWTFLKVKTIHNNPRANGTKRRARVLIPPAIYTRGNESISEL